MTDKKELAMNIVNIVMSRASEFVDDEKKMEFGSYRQYHNDDLFDFVESQLQQVWDEACEAQKKKCAKQKFRDSHPNSARIRAEILTTENAEYK